ncbi:hypothetical protein KPG71_19140 [Roseovarius sp. PS-C2]|uniref:MarC family protein n=1 Tax=Roseovarius sp. PS-C2 TaxID=2820814 RepID=UPI001C0D33B2|nr:MarC family protein [Roseovarius sp. PS-C2]MBU3262141.1 hypothetical protein [Roseovarius sp. PS-C2]
MDWSSYIRSFVVLFCILDPFFMLFVSKDTSKIVVGKIHALIIIRSAIYSALFLLVTMAAISGLILILDYRQQVYEICGAIVVATYAVLNLFFPGDRSLARREPPAVIAVDKVLQALSIPGLVAIAFLVSETQGMLNHRSYVSLTGFLLAFHFLVTLRICAKYKERPWLPVLSRYTNLILLIISVDIVLSVR